MSTIIDIEKLSIVDNMEEDEINLDEKELEPIIKDSSYSKEKRLKALELYCKTNNFEDSMQLINGICMTYQLSGLRSNRKFLIEICKFNIPSLLKSIVIKTLITCNDKERDGYDMLSECYPSFNDLLTPYRMELVKMLMNSEEHYESSLKYFNEIIDSKGLNEEFRYRTILTLDKKYKKFIKPSLLCFLSGNSGIDFKILSSQNLLQNEELNKDEQNMIFNVLLCICKDKENKYNRRADACDVLLQYSNDLIKEEAIKIMSDLGKEYGKVKNLYDNAQNVHNKSVEDSVLSGIEFLQSFAIMKVKGEEINLDFVKNCIMSGIEEKNIIEKLDTSFNRISMDRALYSKYNCSLENILLKIWTYKCSHDSEKEIEKRLVEELIDMSGTCSSGFVSRLINSISGFGDFSIRISWRDQIVSNLSGRLNAKIRDMDDLVKQERILVQMTSDTGPESRKEFLRFFRKNILNIREEMYEEFKEHITDIDFDLYFRGAISMYETGNFN